MDPTRYSFDAETGKLHDLNNWKKMYVSIPAYSIQTGKGLFRYIQSLHQYQKEQELKSTR